MSVPQLPGLLLDPPRPSPGNRFDLTIRTVNGTSLDSNRLAGVEVWTATNLSQSLITWPKLTNSLVLTNGNGRAFNVNGSAPQGYFILREHN
jgi:hypothetical protein